MRSMRSFHAPPARRTLPVPVPAVALVAAAALWACAGQPAPDHLAAADEAAVYTEPPVAPYDRFFTDSAAAAELEARGDRYATRRAVLYLPGGALEPEQGRALADTLDRVVAGVEAALGGPHPWQRFQRPRVRYYLPNERFISHGSRGARVYIPLSLARGGWAPYVHETVHALMEVHRDTLAQRPLDEEAFVALLAREPFWLWEGLADVVGTDVAEARGLPNADIFEAGGSAGVDDSCRGWLARDEGRHVLPYIASVGRPPRLPFDRENVAPPFYTCSHSFTRWLIQRHGVPAVASIMAEDDAVAVLTRLTGRRPAELRGEWLAAIGATSPGSEAAMDTAAALDRLRWMAGCWERRTPDQHTEEQWMMPRGGTMLGMSRAVRDGRTVGFESLRIEERNGRLVYVASPSRQAMTEFTATAVSDTLAAFENPAHDFPQRILYRPGRADSLWARIEGEIDGRERAVDFRLARSECG